MTPSRVLAGDGSPLKGVTHLALGNTSSCALAEGGRAFCWGNNNLGQLGRGTRTPGEPAAAEVLDEGGGPLSDVWQLAHGGEHACALSGDGGVRCWGYNKFGQLGRVSPGEASPVPLRASGLSP